jgi:hypothetical protein
MDLMAAIYRVVVMARVMSSLRWFMEGCRRVAVRMAVRSWVMRADRRPGTACTPYGPDFLLNGETLSVPADLDGLAVCALDRILADESEWRSLWEEGEHYVEAQAELLAIRTVLAN